MLTDRWEQYVHNLHTSYNELNANHAALISEHAKCKEEKKALHDQVHALEARIDSEMATIEAWPVPFKNV